MKKLIFLTLSFLFLQNLKAQDEIFLTDNTKLLVTVIDADSAGVKYTLRSDPNGGVKSEVAKHIKLVYYEDGRILNYSHPEKTHHHIHKYNEKEHYYITHYNLDLGDSELTVSKNVLFVNAAEILNSSIGVSYWREMFKSRVIFEGSVGTGFSTPFQYYLNTYDFRNVLNFTQSKKAYDVRAGLYFKTSGKGVLSHFIGASIRAAQYNGTFETTYISYIIDTNGQPVPVANFEKHGFVYNETYAYLNNGLLVKISPQFNLMLNVGVGMRSPKAFIANHPANFYPEIEGQQSIDIKNPMVQVGFSFGYRF